MSEVTRLLDAAAAGNPAAAGELLPLVYQELRQLAAARLAHEKPGQTLGATALVHEAYLRLVGPADGPNWNSRGHFFAAAAEAMRRILIDNARRKRTEKHGARRSRRDLEVFDVADEAAPEDLIDLDEALAKLAREDPAKAELVKLRYFAGLTVKQAAKSLGVSPRTADFLSYARAWLLRELEHERS